MRKVFLDSLPQKEGVGANKNKLVVDWINSEGYKVEFEYDNISGEFCILKYEEPYVHVNYKNNELKIRPESLKNANLGLILKTHTNEFKIDLNSNIQDDKRDLTIVDRENRKDKNNKTWKWYKYKCNKCGYDEGWILESNLLKNIGCSCCYGKTVVLGVNTIWDTDPWMIPFVGEEIAKTHTARSNKSIYPICPDCGRVQKRKTSIDHIYSRKKISCTCGDGFSYPEKIMFNILEQTSVGFVTQLTKSSLSWCGNYRYDFYIPSLNCIIESHGLQHYKDTKRKGARTLKEEQDNDRNKEILAKENGIKSYITIDCRESNLDYIKDKILNSKLNILLNLSTIDWNESEIFAMSNLTKKVCQIKQENPTLSNVQIGRIFKLNRDTVSEYLKKGKAIGWIESR
jgi:predicted RNA-binding Zn-ribbon protein involved in translation (DUF1610 family)